MHGIKKFARPGKVRRLALGLLAAAAAALWAEPRPAAAAPMVEAWGLNGDGQLGNGTTTNSSTPVAVTINGSTSGVTAVAAGYQHSLAVQNGGAYAWGYNGYGQLGNGTTTGSTTPLAVSTLGSGVTAVAGGYYHSLAVRNGGAYAWGDNSFGQLGNSTSTISTTPLAVGTLGSGVTAVAGGLWHSLAVRNGGVYAWGYNADGELGNGTTTISSTPVAVTINGSTSGVTAVAAGSQHSLAVQNGALYAWGYNGYGQLGNGTTTNSSTPVAVTINGSTGGVTAVAAGDRHSLAVKNGNVYAWGFNYLGQLGDGTSSNHLAPELIDPTDLKNIVAVAAGAYSSYALSSDGSIWDWGDNGFGELGLGNTISSATPQHLLPPGGYAFTSIATSNDGSQALAILAPTPEPAGLSLLALGGLALLRRGRRRSR